MMIARSTLDDNPTTNHGILALLQFCIQASDKVLSDHL